MDGFEDIKGYEKLYAINKEGSVWSYRKKQKGMPLYETLQFELKQNLKNTGYYAVILSKNNKSFCYGIHRLLALQFIPNPDNLPEVDHINQIRTDNRLENLRWVNLGEQMRNQTRKIANSGYKNITLLPSGSFRVRIYIDKRQCVYDKTFKTIDDALSERDCEFDYLGIMNSCYD